MNQLRDVRELSGDLLRHHARRVYEKQPALFRAVGILSGGLLRHHALAALCSTLMTARGYDGLPVRLPIISMVLNNALVKILKLTWQMVDPHLAIRKEYWCGHEEHPWRDPALIPDEDWHLVEKTSLPRGETIEGLIEQYRGLLHLVDEGEPIRHVRLFVAPEPDWVEVQPGEIIEI